MAIKIAKSSSYNEMMRNSKLIADQIKKYKSDSSLTNQYKNLDSVQQRDSMLKYLFRTDSFSNASFKMSEATKKMKQDFSEITSLDPESRKKVLQKAAALWLKENQIK